MCIRFCFYWIGKLTKLSIIHRGYPRVAAKEKPALCVEKIKYYVSRKSNTMGGVQIAQYTA